MISPLQSIRSRSAQHALALGAALAGVLLAFYATAEGIGVTPDSVTYMGAAYNLLHGNGLRALSWAGALEPLAVYPPLFSTSLAVLALPGIEFTTVARLLNATLYAANILLVVHLMRRVSGDSAATLLGAMLFLTSTTMLRVHSMAWSEPLFLLTSFSGLYCLAIYFGNAKAKYLIASGVLVAGAFLTRYVGASVVAAGVAAIVMRRNEAWGARLKEAALFSAISAGPVLVWVARNLALADTATSMRFAYHPVTADRLASGLEVLSLWILPSLLPASPRVVLLLIVIVGITVAALMLRGRPEEGANTDLGRILTLFALAYGGLLILAISFYNADTPLDDRLLAPLFAPALLAGLALITIAGARNRTALKRSMIVACLALTLLYARRATVWVRAAHTQGQGYNSLAWKGSETMSFVRAVPSGTAIYSNGPRAVQFLAARAATLTPPQVDLVTGKTNADYPAQLDEMARRLQEGSAVLVIFEALSNRWWLASEADLIRELGLEPLRIAADGRIYGRQ